ncbi:hypothetical protein [Mucilaginibacter ginsenosidivorax]|nr:hypothetical protein [Mucilaginibacter ginsenosidivorax]
MTVFVITHVLMLISIVRIGWAAFDTADVNIDSGINTIPHLPYLIIV